MFNVIKITIFSLLLQRQTSQIDIYRINALSIHFLYHILLYTVHIFLPTSWFFTTSIAIRNTNKNLFYE